ncbi:MAG: M48 family metallopeptidase [Gammaproteobacteria bacterium]|nr:M48 family metallopeptidase [Gammaproteobacteria bacterium]
MNFFEAQDKARRNTTRLIILFVLAVSGLILLTNVLLLGVMIYVKTGQFLFSLDALQEYYSWREFVGVSLAVCLLISGGSLYKTMSLSGGGATVAEMLGGRLISQATSDLQQRQLLNVVEEMAIAAGMPVPKVYLLEDTSINAFAAGRTPANAVIGVTRGTLGRLSREELQGVIAHEFSHIANGDMRLNIRLIGVLHGILLIGMIGYFILRSLRFGRRSRSSNSKGGSGILAIAAVGFGLMVIGYAGSFFGQWIKAIVSRQREYLADSSAVQFTRNKDGIAGALKKIGGGSGVSSYLESASAPEYSHAYFADGVSSFWHSLLATHPPLEKRIRAIEPRWDGQFLSSEISQTISPESSKPQSSGEANIGVAAAILSSAEQAISQVGILNEENIEYVHQLIVAMPSFLRSVAQDAYSSRALIYAMLINLQKDEDAALSVLLDKTEPDIQALTVKLVNEVRQLDDKFKLPLLELAVNALREMSPNQFVHFKTKVDALIRSDRTVNLSEWIIQRFLIQQLDEHFGFRKPKRAKYASLEPLRNEVTTLLSLIAFVEHKDDENASKAFDSGVEHSGLGGLQMLSRKAFELESLNRSLDELMRLRPLQKPRLLKACVALILEDGQTTTKGIELVRTISSCLDCPMPPFRVDGDKLGS